MTASTLERPTVQETNEPQLLISLPVHLLHCVAQFASTDPSKSAINKISLYRDDSSDVVTLAATNGHHLLRIILPEDSTSIKELEPGQRLLIDPAAFMKRPLVKEKAVRIFSNGKAEIYGHTSSEYKIVLWKTNDDGYKFPDYDQLFPDEYHNKPEKPFAFNPRYLLDFLKLANYYSINGVVKWQMNSPNTPMVQTFVVSSEWVNKFCGKQTVTIEHLLMPITIRP